MSIRIKLSDSQQKTVPVIKKEPDDDLPQLLHGNQQQQYNYTLPPKAPEQTYEEYWAQVAELGECTFCGEQGHDRKKCPTLKANMCYECGFPGHTPKKCNKIARRGDLVGMCTICKGDAKWGHWLLTCPVRQERFGDFIFPEGVDKSRALAPLGRK